MRLALLALCFAGCFPVQHDDDWDQPQGGWGSGWGGGGGTSGYGCEADSECGGLTCTRTGECLPAAQVRAARTIWTLGDAAASEVSCRRSPDLAITFFSSTNEQFGYQPVPCDAGKFTVDKMPLRFTSVQLARQDDYSGGGTGTFDANGTASIDLPY